jgi:hypothetical protein
MTSGKRTPSSRVSVEKSDSLGKGPGILIDEPQETVIESAHVESIPKAETRANETKNNAKNQPPLPPIRNVATMIPRLSGQDPFHVELNIPGTLQYLLAREHDALSKPSFDFTISEEAACNNWKLL